MRLASFLNTPIRAAKSPGEALFLTVPFRNVRSIPIRSRIQVAPCFLHLQDRLERVIQFILYSRWFLGQSEKANLLHPAGLGLALKINLLDYTKYLVSRLSSDCRGQS